MKRRCIVGVIGGNKCTAAASSLAATVGSAIAQAGAFLLTGGGPAAERWTGREAARGEPIKDAAMRGAADGELKHATQARLVGILPSTDRRQFIQTGRQLLIRTPFSSCERDPITALTSDAVIVFEGGHGTLTELAFAYLAEKPVFLVASLPNLRHNLRVEMTDLRNCIAKALRVVPRPADVDGVVELLSAKLNEAEGTEGTQVVSAAIAQTGLEVSGESAYPDLKVGGLLDKRTFEQWLLDH